MHFYNQICTFQSELLRCASASYEYYRYKKFILSAMQQHRTIDLRLEVFSLPLIFKKTRSRCIQFYCWSNANHSNIYTKDSIIAFDSVVSCNDTAFFDLQYKINRIADFYLSLFTSINVSEIHMSAIRKKNIFILKRTRPQVNPHCVY